MVTSRSLLTMFVGKEREVFCGEHAWNEARYIRDEISRQNAIAIIVKRDNELIAFGWGYIETGEEFANQKYKTEGGRDLVAKVAGRKKTVFYLSERGTKIRFSFLNANEQIIVHEQNRKKLGNETRDGI